jgi:adenylate cyclase class 2
MIVGRDERSKDIETEVKIHYPDLDELRQRLEQAGAEQVRERVHEWNMRYDKKSGSFADEGYVLRLRRDNVVRLTYKGLSRVEQGIMQREELEVEVSDYDTMHQILLKLGFSEHMIYEKYRTVYEINQTEVVLDEMPFGNFIEIEGDTENIEDVLVRLNLQDAKRHEHSYASLFDFVKHHLDLDFRDLTFENFEDIDVPEHAFVPPGSIVIE